MIINFLTTMVHDKEMKKKDLSYCSLNLYAHRVILVCKRLLMAPVVDGWPEETLSDASFTFKIMF